MERGSNSVVQGTGAGGSDWPASTGATTFGSLACVERSGGAEQDASETTSAIVTLRFPLMAAPPWRGCHADLPQSTRRERAVARARRAFPRALRAAGEQALELGRIGEQLLAARASVAEAFLDRLDQPRLEVSVAGRAGTALAHALLPLGELGGREEELQEIEEQERVRILGFLGSAAVRRDRADRPLESLPALEDPQRVAVALAHLLTVESGNLRELLARRDLRLGTHEDLSVRAVEVSRHVLRHLDVLHLVLAHRDEVRVVRQDVGGHQDRIRE